MDPATQVFHFQVLYDDLLNQKLTISKKLLGLPGKGNATFRDINGRPLQLPNMIFPYKRALYNNSFYAYQDALRSNRPHVCATASAPTEERWTEIRDACARIGSDMNQGLIGEDDNDSVSDNLELLDT